MSHAGRAGICVSPAGRLVLTRERAALQLYATTHFEYVPREVRWRDVLQASDHV